MLTTAKTPDYVGTLRHACPRCNRPASIRRSILRDDWNPATGEWKLLSDVDYCEWIDCGWEQPHTEPSAEDRQ